MRFVGRSRVTLYRWRKAGIVKVGTKRGKWYYDKDSLREARKEAKRRQQATELQNQNRRYLAGPGRGHKKLARNEDQLPLFCA
ncbi:helix-turn-helix domain-containing protein [Antrihabitans cavernicola]